MSGFLKFAKIISYVFDGSILVLPIFLAVCFYNQEYSSYLDILPAFFVSIVFIALIPYTFILYLYISGKISEIHMPKRKERFLPLLIINLSLISGFIVLMFLKSSSMLKSVYMIYMLGLPIISVITVFYKISFHSSYITMFSLTYLFVFGRWAILSLPLIPLVSWSRVKLRRHTVGQVLLGICVTSVVTFSVFNMFGYLSSEYWAVGEIISVFHNAAVYLSPGLPGYGTDIIYYIIAIILITCLSSEKRRRVWQLDFSLT